MTDFHLTSASWRDAWWAAGQDFALLPPVDPDFAALPLWRRAVLRGLLLPLSYRKRTHAWIARLNTRPVGYLYARPQGRLLLIDSLGVLPDFQRRGVARTLLSQAAKSARDDDLPLLGMPVAAANAPALAFARALNFQPYRTRKWVLESPDALPTPKETWRVEELPASETLPAYQRWQERALRSGMAWAAESLLQRPFARRDWVGYARHWVCYRGKEESAYLRIAGLRGEYRAYLSCRLADLKTPAPLAWLGQALQTYTAPFRHLTLELPSDVHMQASEKVFAAACMQAVTKPRFLMLRKA